MTMHMTWPLMAVMLLTVAFVIGVGIFQSRKVRSAEGYSVGGRSAGVPMVAGGIAGTVVGGGATVGTAQLAYSVGLSAWWFTLGSGIAFILMGIFYAQKMRSTGLSTIPQFLGMHYGRRAERLSSVISSIGILLSAVASCLPGMEIISSIFGVGELPAAIILMTLVAAYTFFGGMKSAAIGGILKMAVIWLSLFVCGFKAYEVLASSSVAIPPSHLDLFGRGFEVSMSNLFSMIVGVLCTQTYIQCIFSADTPITAAAGCITAALIVIPVGLPSVAVGMYMSAFDPNVVPVLTLPTYFTNHASFLVGGLAMGGIVLSLISSIGGLSLGIGTMLVTDILMPILHLQDDKALLRLTKISVLSVMAAACVIAAMNRGTQVLFWNYLSMGLRGGGIFLPLTLSVFFPEHLKRGWAVLSMAGSTVAAILAVVLHLPIDSLFAGLIVSVLLILPGLRLKRVDGE